MRQACWRQGNLIPGPIKWAEQMPPVGRHSVMTAAATVHRALASCLEQFQASSVGGMCTTTLWGHLQRPPEFWGSQVQAVYGPPRVAVHVPCRPDLTAGTAGTVGSRAALKHMLPSSPLPGPTSTLTTAANTLFSHGSWGALFFLPFPAPGLEDAHINANAHVITTPSMGLHA